MLEHLRTAIAELTAPGADYEMEEVEVFGRPLRSYAAMPASLRAVWEATAAHGDATYLVYEDERISYADAHATVVALADQLVDRFGVRPGDRVALAARNYPEWILAFWAVASVGGVAVALNSWWVGSELEYGLTDSGARVLVCDGERLERIAPHLDAVRAGQPLDVIGVRLDGPAPEGITAWSEVVAAGAGATGLPAIDVGLDDDATIFYTSGTTGHPKGAVGTHRNILTNLMNVGFWGTAQARAKELAGEAAAAAPARSGPNAAMLMTVPLFHVTGCHSILLPITAGGGKIVLMYRWDAERALELIERERVTGFTGVPTMAWELVESPSFTTRDTSSLASVGGGGAPAPPELVRRVDRDFANAAPSVGYGLTETSSVTTLNAGAFYLERPDSVGLAMPVIDVKVVDPLGDEVPVGETGELWIRGPNVIKEYFGKPEATAAAITDGGWFHSGDVARIDEDGFVFIVDRLKDVVIRGGENIYCAEVEAALYEHPGVYEASVFGVPHDRLGEEVGAAVLPKPGVTLEPADLEAHCRERLAAFKVPAHWYVVAEALPRNAAGKIPKREVRDLVLGEAAATG
ncbi:MAG: class I adenylate-forming enzyme family protein [Actinomycetota bacterium]|nr:class I adenylate-forming enzyme family protein [Actinomycetota bacterium]